MKAVAKQIAALAVSFSLAMQPLAASAEAATALPAATPPQPAEPVVTPASLEAASNLRMSSEYFQARVLPKIAKVKSATATGAAYAEEIIQMQAMIILLAALSYQSIKEHREMVRLANGAPLPGDNAPVSQNWCDAKAGGLTENMLCSGEFYLGILGGGFFMGANAAGGKLVSYLLGKTGARIGFMKYIGAMLSGAFMMAGAQSSAYLWTQAVKMLPDKNMILAANGIAGRAVGALASGKLTDFKASPDGKIFGAILQNIYDILVADETMRSQWIYNTWRFGIARGEFITAVGSIMAATAVSELTKGGIRFFATGGGMVAAGLRLTAPAIAFIVCTVIGFSIMDILINEEIPHSFTEHLQNMRQLFDGIDLTTDRNDIKMLAYVFSPSHYPAAGDPNYIKLYQKWFGDYFAAETNARSSWVNIGIEKFYELSVEERVVQTKIDIAETAIRNADLQKNLYFDVDGEILTYEQAKAKLCAASRTCHMDVEYQLKALERLKPQVATAEQSLTMLARSIVNQYETDVDMIQSLFISPKFVFPVPVADQLREYRDTSSTLRDNFKLVLSGLSESVRQDQGVQLSTEKDPKTGKSELEQWQDFAREEISIYYTQSFDEGDVYRAIKESAPL